MGKKEKLIASILNNPAAVRFEDACKVAAWLGFEKKGGEGSHVVFAKEGESSILNFQNRQGYVYTYQAKQLSVMIRKYGGK